MCKAVVVLGHGSRRSEANAELMNITNMLKEVQKDWRIENAFVEFASPSLEEVLEKLYDDGIKEVVIVPLFLTVGNHLHQGLPKRLGEFKTGKDIQITMAGHIGADPLLVELIQKRVKQAEGGVSED